MRRPFYQDVDVHLQVVNKKIERFNEKHSSVITDDMYYLPPTADNTAVRRAIDDFDYLVYSYDPSSDETLSDYLEVREELVRYRISVYADMVSKPQTMK